jgi:hypothetical protein
MGLTEALLAMYEEPDEVYELFEYISEFYCEWSGSKCATKAGDLFHLDDDSAMRAPFFWLRCIES